MDVVRQVWDRAVTEQPVPPAWVVALAGLAALLIVLAPGAWPFSRHVVTIVHEGAHGIAALLTGRRLSGIRLHSDTSGVTVSRGRPTGAGMIVTTAAGYVGPALLGLGAALLLGAGHAIGLLWALLAALALLLVQIRNWFGLWSVLCSAGALFAVSWWLPEQAQAAFAYLVAWFLLVAAPRPVVELHATRRRQRTPTSDADQLARLTSLPASMWVGMFLVLNVGSLLLGGRWLLADVG